jgi:excisionase family DNA binding protein
MMKEILSRLEDIQASIRALQQATTRPLDFDEGAAYLHLSKSHLYQLTSKGLISHFKPSGKKIFFEKGDLDAYLLRNRVSAAEEIEQEAASYVVNGIHKQSKVKNA